MNMSYENSQNENNGDLKTDRQLLNSTRIEIQPVKVTKKLKLENKYPWGAASHLKNQNILGPVNPL